jgi:hypothetical protein
MTEEKKNDEDQLREILEFLQGEGLITEFAARGRPFGTPFELKSEDFMRFARRDLKDTTEERSLVNALSNIKRAIDCRTASLLCFFGVYDRSKKEDWNFPQSTDFLLKVGVLAPNILRKINKKRNELEHEFKKPTYEEVTDFLDVAQLFLAFTEQFLQQTYGKFSVIKATRLENVGDFPWLSIEIDSQKGFIELSLQKSSNESSKIVIRASDEENYTKILSRIVKGIIDR